MNLEYKTLYKGEIIGNHSLGVEVRVSLHRPITEADERAARQLADKLVEALQLETARLDPDVAVERELERQAGLQRTSACRTSTPPRTSPTNSFVAGFPKKISRGFTMRTPRPKSRTSLRR